MGDVVGDRVGLLCDELSRWPELTQTIRDGGAQAQLNEVLKLLADPNDSNEQHMAQLLDAIEDACARQGLALQTRAIPSLPPGTGWHGGGLAGWTCPLDRCTRVVLPDETTDPPTCAAAHGEAARMKPYRPGPQ